MLHLASRTPPSWTARALAHIDEILVDHAHCEKKAAGTAVQLIFRYTQYPALLAPLSGLAREELSHFELVLAHITRRGGRFVAQKPSPYPGALRSIVRDKEPHTLLDTLLCCAMIEARSCERMQLLAEALEDPALKALYEGLLASEARHHAIYTELASAIFPAAEVRARLAEIAAHEASVLAAPPLTPRLHN